MAEANHWLSDRGYFLGEFKQVNQYAGGGRPFVEAVWMGCFNGLPLEKLLDHIRPGLRSSVSLVIQREHDDKPWLLELEAGKDSLILPPEGGSKRKNLMAEQITASGIALDVQITQICSC
jgi:hypothetical protein